MGVGCHINKKRKEGTGKKGIFIFLWQRERNFFQRGHAQENFLRDQNIKAEFFQRDPHTRKFFGKSTHESNFSRKGHAQNLGGEPRTLGGDWATTLIIKRGLSFSLHRLVFYIALLFSLDFF